MIKAFSEVFTPEVRDEAQRLFAAGSVEVLAVEESFLTTSVKDFTSERVIIRRRGDRFQISCTCPEGKSGACAHVLASMLAARGLGFGRGEKPGPKPVEEISHRGADGPAHAAPDEPKVARLRSPRGDEPSDPFAEMDDEMAEPSGLPSVDWRFRLATLKSLAHAPGPRETEAGIDEGPQTELLFGIDAAASASSDGALVLIIAHREMKRDREWGRIKFARPWRGLASDLHNPDDRRILMMLSGADRDADLASTFRLHDVHRVAARYRIGVDLQWIALSMMAETGRLVLRHPPEKDEATSFLAVDEGAPYSLRLQVSATTASFSLSGELARGEERVPLGEIDLVTRGGMVILREITVMKQM